MGNSESNGYANSRQAAARPCERRQEVVGRVLMGISTLGISEGVIAIADSGYREKNFHKKYMACEHNGRQWDQLSCGLFGSCINESRSPTGMRAKAGSGNLSGIIADGNNMYKYFLENGAKVAVNEFSIPAVSGAYIKTKIKNFLQQPGNNKLLYLTGHGDRNGCWSANDESLAVIEVFGWLSDVEFNGQFTLFVDSCYSGKIAQLLKTAINERGLWHKHALEGMERAAHKQGRKVYINLRLSSLASETSRDGGATVGGRYSDGYLRLLRKEHVWTPKYTGYGWGTKVMVSRKPNQSDVVWSTSKEETQTDLVVDFVYDPSCRKWTWHYPSDRAKYL